jgi:1-acyl-sn-glycerol-3-phosphate acyltransferase
VKELLPGGRAPQRRLPVTPPGSSRGGRGWAGGGVGRAGLAGAGAGLAAAGRRLLPRPRFPLAAPTWPTTVPRPPLERTLGVDYDSDWARSPAARLGRAVVQEVVAAPLLRALAAPTVDGLDRISHLDEPVIFAANHASHLDAPLIVSVVPERWRRELFVAGAADYFFDTQAKAAAFAFLLNAVPVERRRVSRVSVRRVSELLDDDWSMLIFPEGGRSPDGWAQAHQAGAAWMAERAGRPLVPVHVEGTRQILAKGSTRLRPGRTRVTFGRPLRPEPGEDPRALAARLETAIAELADEVAHDWYSARRRAAAGATPPLTGPDAASWRRAWTLADGRRQYGRGRAGGGRGESVPRRVRGGPDSARWPWRA